MPDKTTCRNGSLNCHFPNAMELALTHEMMKVIADVFDQERLSPCPLCLRDTLLTAASLLHLEGSANRNFGQVSQEQFDLVEQSVAVLKKH